MRKIAVLALACALATLAAAPGSPQARFDFGAMVPRATDLDFGNEVSRNVEGFLMEWPIVPLPEVDFHYQWSLGPFRLGLGARAFSILVENIAWPDACAELALGRIAIEAHAGAGAFAMFGIRNQFAFGDVAIPDLSVWLKLGKRDVFRLGGGVLGLCVPPAFGDAMFMLVYLGGKASIVAGL